MSNLFQHVRLLPRVLSDGQVIVNDPSGRRVVLLDSSLKKETLVYDTSTTGLLKYAWPEVTFAGPGDSTWLTDPPQHVFRVLDPKGYLVRRAPFVLNSDIMSFGSSYSQTSFAPGGLLYFALGMSAATDAQGIKQDPDSMLLVRLNMKSRKRDTIGVIDFRVAVRRVVDSVGPETHVIRTVFPAFEIGDAMTVTSTGELAIVRAKDFHVDWIDSSGRWRSTPPVDWPWHTLTVAEIAKVRDDASAFLTSGRVMTFARKGTEPAEATNLVGPVPSREPAFLKAGAYPDREGRIWLQLGTSFMGQTSGPPVFAVIDSTGRIVDRVSLPQDRTLAGFGPAGTLFAVARINGGAAIERYRLPAITR